MTKPLVSVIMPCASANWLGEAVISVLRQSEDRLELILIIDGPVQGVTGELKPFRSDPRLRIIELPERRGAARARASGILAAEGEWIAFCDADDVWDSNKLQLQLSDPEAPHATLVCAAYRRIGPSGTVLGNPLPVPRHMTYQDLLSGCPIGNSTVLIRHKVLQGRTPPDLPMRCDYAFWLELLRNGGYVVAIPYCLVSYRVHGRALSANKLRAALWQWRVLRSQNLKLSECAKYWMQYALRRSLVRINRGLV